MVEVVLFAGVTNWLVTTIIVEGVIFEGARAWVDRHVPGKVAELCHCHLCAGTWVGFALAALIPGPFAGPLPIAIILNGFLYKAIGHLTLEIAAMLREANRILRDYRRPALRDNDLAAILAGKE